MTTFEEPLQPTCVEPRSETAVLLDQLQAIESWTRRNRPMDLRLLAADSREARLDLARRRDVAERARQALIDRTARHLQETGGQLRSEAVPRAVIVHRNAWFKGKVRDGLNAGGVAVVADLENGAEAVGVVVAEQPELVIVEDRLPMISGLEVTQTVRSYAPAALVVVQVGNDWEIAPYLEAGARTVYARRVPPAEIVADLLSYVAEQRNRQEPATTVDDVVDG